ncbi:MAG: hypothetical protein Q8P24_02055 [Desulfobacterales bacterium]|nr:hypothetical protein [Desulfobacterales bacterium]MDZ4341693.1 hypothetical protein [Candidatus Binatia bacterium]
MSLRLTQEEYDAIRSGVQEKKTIARSTVKDSKYKRGLELIFLSLGLEVEREYRFHETRKWRFDYALPAMKIAIEYEGLNFHGGASGHQTIKGVAGGNEKYSEAAIAGWCLILVNALSLESGVAHDLIRRAVDSRTRLVGEDL